ncbi:MAG: hypothetical protein U0Y68_18345 [Blastocatellia bacterium]
MAVEFTQAVFDISPFKSETLLVQIALADWADRDGRIENASFNRIADRARIERRSAIRIIQKLIQKGHLQKLPDTENEVNIYGFSALYKEAAADFRGRWKAPKPAFIPSDLPSVSGSDLPSVSGSDLPSVSGSDLPSVSGSDLPSVSGSDQKHPGNEYMITGLHVTTYQEQEEQRARAPEPVSPFDAFDSQPLPQEPDSLPGELDAFEQLVAKTACETSTHHAVKKESGTPRQRYALTALAFTTYRTSARKKVPLR